ncbi:hypothetical protein [Actinacidiphila glaucinigra]
MGVKPVAASPRSADEAVSAPRFGAPHAFVIIGFVVTAAVLAGLGMAVKDVLFLVGGAGSLGAAVVLVVVTGGRAGGRFGRFLRAYMSAGN